MPGPHIPYSRGIDVYRHVSNSAVGTKKFVSLQGFFYPCFPIEHVLSIDGDCDVVDIANDLGKYFSMSQQTFQKCYANNRLSMGRGYIRFQRYKLLKSAMGAPGRAYFLY